MGAPTEAAPALQATEMISDDSAPIGFTANIESSERKEVIGRCKCGRELVRTGPTEDGWACDGRSEASGCKSGITDYYQTSGLKRFECRTYDYDLCERCHERLLGFDVPTIDCRSRAVVTENLNHQMPSTSIDGITKPAQTSNTPKLSSCSGKLEKEALVARESRRSSSRLSQARRSISSAGSRASAFVPKSLSGLSGRLSKIWRE